MIPFIKSFFRALTVLLMLLTFAPDSYGQEQVDKWRVTVLPFSNYIFGYNSVVNIGYVRPRGAVYLGVSTHLTSRYKDETHSHLFPNTGVVSTPSQRFHLNFGAERGLLNRKQIAVGLFVDALAGRISISKLDHTLTPDSSSRAVANYTSFDNRPVRFYQLSVGGFLDYKLFKAVSLTARAGLSEGLVIAPVFKYPAITDRNEVYGAHFNPTGSLGVKVSF
jgi:hypothetical protein